MSKTVKGKLTEQKEMFDKHRRLIAQVYTDKPKMLRAAKNP